MTAPVPGFIRDAQRRAAAAAKPEAPRTPEETDRSDAASIAEARDRKIWPPESLEAERKAGAYVARLYRFLRVEGGVKTPKGQGTLHSAHSSGCQVLLTRQKATGELGGGKRFRPLVEFEPEEIEPYRKGS
ncbi:MAG: hypothetical protein M3P49_16425 [Actinomycetota bacterium]|nr:hypothetical protein [Actinomycetota bacterium]